MELLLPFPRPLTPARFVERPHRFAVRCHLEADGAAVECHLPDPGRLTDLLTPGRRLWLEGPFPPPRRLPWGVVLAETPRAFVHLVPARANALLPLALRAGALPDLLSPDQPHALQAEVTRQDARLDFLLTPEGAAPILIEVKAAALRRGQAVCWPDAPSQRALKHLHHLRAEVEAGRRAALVFLAARGDVEGFALADDIDPTFAAALRDAHAAGVEVYAARFTFDIGGAGEPAPLPVALEPLRAPATAPTLEDTPA